MVEDSYQTVTARPVTIPGDVRSPLPSLPGGSAGPLPPVNEELQMMTPQHSPARRLLSGLRVSASLPSAALRAAALLVVLVSQWSSVLSSAHAEDDDDRRAVTVTGTSVIRVAPDIIVWRISTTDTDPNLLQAKQRSDEKAKKILALREALEIAPEDIQSGNLRIEKIYQRDRQGNRLDFRHFEITRSFTIRQRNLERFDEFLTRLVGGGDLEADFSFESSKFHELRIETRRKAVLAARDKARDMTDTLGAVLGPVLKIDEYQPSYFQPSPMSNSAFGMSSPPAEVDNDSGTLAPGAIEIRVSVVIRFEVK